MLVTWRVSQSLDPLQPCTFHLPPLDAVRTHLSEHTHTLTHKYPKIKGFKSTPGDSVPLCINIHWQNNENPVSPCSGNQFNHCSSKSAWVLPSQKDFSKPIEFPIAQQLKQFNYIQLSQFSPKHPKAEN